MSIMKIIISQSDNPFTLANEKSNWIDTSFSDTPFSKGKNTIGALRWQGVYNGDYKNKHPILNKNGETIGYSSGLSTDLGPTYECIYAGGCFWIAHQTFRDMKSVNDVSSISLVEERKSFFSSKRKFKVVKTFEFEKRWLDSIKAFKLLGDESRFLYFTEEGFCLFDVNQQSIKTKIDFPDLGINCYSDFTLSPNDKFLALACRSKIADGDFIYGSFIRLYNLETGEASSDLFIDIDHEERWSLDFSEEGSQLRANSNSSTYIFELKPK